MLTAIASAPLTAASTASAFEGSASPISFHWAPTLVVIDSAVDDAVSLATAVRQGTVVILQEGDGIAEITAALHPGMRQLVLVAHGEPGVLHLGGAAVTAETLEAQRQGLQDWNVDEIVLCSCRVGEDSALVETLAQLTDSRVVATNEILGAGNWLPQMEDVFEATVLQHYSGTLNVSSVTSTTANATYGVGSTVNVTVNFSQALNLVGGNLILTLNSGATLTIAPFSGQTSAVATYTVGSGQASADLNVTAISLAGGATLKNGSAVDATLTIPLGFALKDSKALVIDGIAPVSSGVYNGFSTQSTFATGSQPYSVTVGDFNGDSKADLAIANNNASSVSVLLGTGSGGFSTQTTFATGSNPRSVTVGDFNGDSKADLAIASSGSDRVSVLLGTGSGGFSAQTTFATGSQPYSVTVGDFNGDGNQDLAIANYGFPSCTVSVLLGNGSGGFTTQSTFITGVGSRSVTVGDFNGDGKQDLAVANGSSSVSVLLGNGSGGFTTQTSFATGTNSRSVTVGDFNGDGKQDLATANYNASTVSVLLGNGSGGFSAQTSFATGLNPRSVTVGDFNGDGKQDLAIANNGSSVSVLLGTGSGGFSTQSTFATGSGPRSVTVGDFNGDGKADLAIANQSSTSVSVLLNSPLPALTLPTNGTYTVGQLQDLRRVARCRGKENSTS